MAQTDRKQIEEIIREEIKNLPEGFLQRVLARSAGQKSALKALGSNVGNMYQAIAKGQGQNLQSPAVARAVAIGSRRIASYEKKLAKVFLDMANDLEMIFGDDFQNAPEQLRTLFNNLDEESTRFLGLVSSLGKETEKALTQSVAKPTQNKSVPASKPSSPPPAPPADDAESEVLPAQKPRAQKSGTKKAAASKGAPRSRGSQRVRGTRRAE